MSEDGYPRSSWDNGERDGSDVGHSSRLGHTTAGAGGVYPRLPQTVQHYIPSSESLDRQSNLGLDGGAPPTPTKAKSVSPHRRSSAESATRPPFVGGSGSGSGSGSGQGARWRDSAMPGAATQSELGHGYAPGAAPRVSMESESVRSMDGETAASAADMATLVEPSFDENILRTLCETDVSARCCCWAAALVICD